MLSAKHFFIRAVLVAWIAAGCYVATVCGATLHLVIGCITADGTNKRCTENRWLYNGDRMQELFEDNVAKDQLRVTRIATLPMTASSVLYQVAAVPDVQPDDALVFYYAGHGGYDQANRQYFWLLPSKDNLYRQTLYDALMAHHPRLMVLISDCCYTFAATKEGPLTMGQAPPTERGRVTSPLFDALFFKQRGVVDFTSAARDQSSYWVGSDLTQGSLFGSSLRGILSDFAAQELTWGQVVSRTRKRTAVAFHSLVKSPDPVTLPNGSEVPQTTQTPYAWALPGPHVGIRASVAAGVDGLRVDETIPPASEAGIKAGDVVLAINGQAIRTEDDLYNAILEAAASSFEVEVKDGKTGQTRKVKVTPR